MKVLFDTNVILDVWLARPVFVDDSAYAMSMVERGVLTGFLCPTTITTLHYIAKKELGESAVRMHLKQLTRCFHMGILDAAGFELALESQVRDFEDAVLEAVAIKSGLDAIVTRNKKDFSGCRLMVFTPLELIRQFLK